jgi:hypothetical protein
VERKFKGNDMGQEWRMSAWVCVIGSYLAARPAFGTTGMKSTTMRAVMLLSDWKRSCAGSCALNERHGANDGGEGNSSTLPDSHPAPYEGVARRKPAATSPSEWYPPSVLRPKPADGEPGES